jgi:ribosome silencing factor RsfS/YbeB/iojap
MLLPMFPIRYGHTYNSTDYTHARRIQNTSMQSEQIKNVAIATLEDMKAIDIQVMDVRELTDITDYMVVSSGSSDRHVKAIADKVLDALRERNVRPLGVEGRESGVTTSGKWSLPSGSSTTNKQGA